MIIIVGLGNPDKKYEQTYHNLGFLAVDRFAQKICANFSKTMCKACVAEANVNGQKVILAKPLTYMNLSGESVVLLKQKYKDARILVIVDDIDLPRGEIRYRLHGSAGTHNGLRSIVSYIGQEFERIKIGIGRDESMDLCDYVLSKIDMKEFDKVLDMAVEEIANRL